MNIFIRFSVLLVTLICIKNTIAQTDHTEKFKIDSIKMLIQHANHDTTLINAWTYWSTSIQNEDSELAFLLNSKIDSLCEFNLSKELSPKNYIFYLQHQLNSLNRIGLWYIDNGEYEISKEYFNKTIWGNSEIRNQEQLAYSLSYLGKAFLKQANYFEALELLSKSQSIFKTIKNDDGIANTLLSIGMVYYQQGDYSKAIENYTESLLYYEKVGNRKAAADAHNNIGIIYKSQDELEKAIEHFSQSLLIRQEYNDIYKIGVSYLNLGVVYDLMTDTARGIEFYNKALVKFKEVNNKRGIAAVYSNIGNLYVNAGIDSNTVENFKKSLEIFEEIGDQKGIAHTNIKMARAYIYREKYQEAIKHAKIGLEIALEIGHIRETSKAYRYLWKAYKYSGQYKNAVEAHEFYMLYKDSLNILSVENSLNEQEYKYEYEKKVTADSVRAYESMKTFNAILKSEKSENLRRKQLTVFLYVFIAFVVIVAFYIYRRFIISNKQKIIIEDQKKDIDAAYSKLTNKNKEMLDSITYAQRIQSAILPPDHFFKKNLPQSFIYYKPKDIVAGDFYWMELKDGKTIFAAADCTGHGVPGAMVSVVCNGALNRSVREFGLTEPGKILDKAREIVIKEFEKSEEDVKDGMDIALCALNGKLLEYAGAHNPIWIVREEKIIETKGNKQPIGKFDNPSPFITHSFDLKEGDVIYIFSDGYVDQFGGEHGKKLKARAFRELILSIQDQSMEKQKTSIDNVFESWRGSLDQVDDVCVIGVKI